MTIEVGAANLAALQDKVAVPNYDRSALRAGIVHLGVGGFHRSHQAVYLDRLLHGGNAFDWGIRGVGVLEADRAIHIALSAQDGLYTLVEKDPHAAAAPRVIGSIVEHLHAPDQGEAVIEAMAAPTTRIVSLTITEGGYGIDVEGHFDTSAPGVVAETREAAHPASAPGFVVEALRRRRERHFPPFTVMSCDNIEGNGRAAREAITAFAGLRDRSLARWIEELGRFPSSMVDRITPATTEADRAELAAGYGVADRWPVVCEPFMQWILEDDFVDGRPLLEEVGVELVADVAPYELMKLRLLNASHQAMCYAGYLVGYRYVHEVAADPLFAGFLLDYMHDEAVPTLLAVPGIDIPSYSLQLIGRFSNPEIRDPLVRLCTNTSDLIPKFLLPVLRQQLVDGGPIERCAAVIACWARYALGVDEIGEAIVVRDRVRNQVMSAAEEDRSRPGAFLEQRDIFGDLADSQRLRGSYVRIARALGERGVRATLERIGRGDPI